MELPCSDSSCVGQDRCLWGFGIGRQACLRPMHLFTLAAKRAVWDLKAASVQALLKHEGVGIASNASLYQKVKALVGHILRPSA